MPIFFLSCVIVLIYIYLGYPLAILIVSIFNNKKVNKEYHDANITILIAAYNEEEHIEATIRNKLELDYPKDKIEIIVISDSSTDKTDEIVKNFVGCGVKLIRQEPRQGKTAALNMAVPHANGDIIVFSDANSIFGHDALRQLVSNFHDPNVGYVTGKMIYINPDGSPVGDGCSAYMKYENFLRECETKIGSIVGVDGGIDAVRKSLYKPMRADQLPDFVLPLMVIEQGYRVVYEPRALLKESALKSSGDEYRMRVRVSLRALWALFDMRSLFDFRRFGLFSWQLISHKAMRYLAFLFMVGVYMSNMCLLSRSLLFKLSYILQNMFYMAVTAGYFREKAGKGIGFLYIPYYFIIINAASAHAFIKFLRGQKQVIWTPRKG